MNTLDATALRLAAVIESSDDAIISQTLDGTIETWNRAAERMFGYTSEEAIGRPIELIVPAANLPADRAMLAGLRSGKGARHFETTGLTRDGATIPISLAISPVLTADGELIGMSRIARDMTTQQALQREAFRLAAIVDSSDDAIVSKDLNGIVRTWNRAAERIFGYKPEEIIGRPITTIIPVERHAEEDLVLSRIRAGKSVDHFETIRQRKDGTLIEISVTVSPIRTADGTVIGASKIVRDITPQRQLARAAEEANRVKDEFLAMLSHELRTPLNAVIGYTQMLRAGHYGDDTGRREHVIDVIERNAKLLSQLVSDVLDVSGIVTGKVRLTLGPCDLRGVVDAAVDVVRPSAEAKGIALQVHTSDEPLQVRCDGDRMQQVFWNLLSNAVKFTPAGGRVAVDVSAAGASAVVTVCDTGVGIRAETLPFVFQRFWQGETPHNRQGLGLGLALAKHFVELHGGTISVESAGEGQGATFTVGLPAVRLDDQSIPKQ
jgi:PAS domain S-box-containing protein